MLILPTRPPLPHSSFPIGKKGDLESLQLRLGPGLHPPVDYVWRREEGEGALHIIIPLTIPVPYGQRNGFSSGSQRSGKRDLLLQSGCVFSKGGLTAQIISHSGLFTVLAQVFYIHFHDSTLPLELPKRHVDLDQFHTENLTGEKSLTVHQPSQSYWFIMVSLVYKKLAPPPLSSQSLQLDSFSP